MTVMHWCLFCTILGLTALVLGCAMPTQNTSSSMVTDVGPGHKLYTESTGYPGQNMSINQPASIYTTTSGGHTSVHTVNPNFQSP